MLDTPTDNTINVDQNFSPDLDKKQSSTAGNNTSDKQLENRFLSAKSTWNDRYANYVNQARLWQIIGLISVIVALISFATSMHLATRSEVMPYIIEVDRLGNAQGGGFATPAQFDEGRIVRAALAEYVTNWRSVSSDMNITKDRINRLYAFLNGNDIATQKMNGYFQEEENNPFPRSKKMTVQVQINSINSTTPKSYLVEWVETEFDRDGIEQGSAVYRSNLTTNLAPSSNPMLKSTNPLGLYITDLDWTKVANQ